MALSGIQGKPTGPLALNGFRKAIAYYIVRQRWRVDGQSNSFGEVGTPSEARPIGQSRLARKPENYIAQYQGIDQYFGPIDTPLPFWPNCNVVSD